MFGTSEFDLENQIFPIIYDLKVPIHAFGYTGD